MQIHHFLIGDKVLLKKKKINKWSTCHEKDFYSIITIHGSTITARRKSDGRTIDRDASKFKFFHDVKKDNCRERLLCSDREDRSSTQNRREEEKNRREHNKQRGEDIEPNENNHQPRRLVRQQEEPQMRELPTKEQTDYLLMLITVQYTMLFRNI